MIKLEEKKIITCCYYRLKVTVSYATSSSSSALQWLPPEQTAGKKHPYLFSQVGLKLPVCQQQQKRCFLIYY